MGDVFGFGISHFPLFGIPDRLMAGIFDFSLKDPDVPAEAKDPRNWPSAMREQWSDDGGTAAAGKHREEMLVGLRRARAALDRFKPDLLIIWGDDQYENFREDVVPAFCIQAYPTREIQPWKNTHEILRNTNYWNETVETRRVIHGNPAAAKGLATALLDDGFDVAYSYKPLHYEGLSHAFLNATLYLDFDRVGFDYPVIPISINCYGRKVIGHRGSFSHFGNVQPDDPPSPSPARCFDLGRAVARAAARSPARVAVCASSSWSHAFLVDHTWRLRPDTARDRFLYELLCRNDLAAWRDVTLRDVEAAGQQEVLNWFCLAGAMYELNCKLEWSDFVETYIFNSNKVTALYEPWVAAAVHP
jgi:hypothetical protein